MADELADIMLVLTWDDSAHGDFFARFEQRYMAALCHCLGVRLAQLRRADPRLAAEAEVALDALSEEALAQFLLHPATSRHLVTSLHSLADVGAYLTAARAPTFQGSSGHLLGCIPLREDYDDRPAGAALAVNVGALAQSTAALIAPVGTFWRAIMRELVLREDRSRPAFFSNSPQGYVGRAIITNGHLPLVDDTMLVEAMVHETIHGFVGMSEAIGLSGAAGARPWLLDRGHYDGVSRVTSPWTGTPLDIPTYLHACFVWWGLLHFWGRLREHDLCDSARKRSRFFRALKGFAGDAFVRELEPHRADISPQLMAVFAEMSDALAPVWREEALEQAL